MSSGSGSLTICMLGDFAVEHGALSVPDGAWRLRKAKTVVKLLALAPGHALHREQLMDVLWPELSPEAAANNLNQALYVARRALEAAGASGVRGLVLREEVVRLAPDDKLWIDVEAFEQAAAHARRAGTDSAYEEALALYTGELLPADRYEPWSTVRRETVREQALTVVEELAGLHRLHGDDLAEIAVLQRGLVIDPLHEELHRLLMRAFDRSGRRQQALAQFHRLSDALREALAADPEPLTRTLYEQILVGAGAPERPERRPPRHDVSRERGNLRPAITSFVGRGEELREVIRLLDRGRLVTLTGPGGVGKTRLALEAAARRAERFPGGVWIVELASVAEGELVVQTVARTLGADLPAGPDPVESLVAELESRGPLLVALDNCEQVIEECASLALDLVQGCPRLMVLVTTREPLRVPGEAIFRLPSLSLPAPAGPDGEPTTRSEAVQLFVERAAAHSGGFTVSDANADAIAAICRSVDGIPLAIELAAALVGVHAPRQIAERLAVALDFPGGRGRGRAPRHETMRKAIDGSHELLDECERVLFRRLGVFARGFSLEAVEGVCADATLPGGIFELLTNLVEKSLVVSEPSHEEARYRLLEPLRWYAQERLSESAEHEDLERRHWEWYLSLVTVLDTASVTGRAKALDRLEAEHDNLRAALRSALADDPDAALRIAAAVWPLWLERGYFTEGAHWLDRALTATTEATPERAEALLGAGALDTRRGAFERRLELAQQRLAILRAVDDEPGIVDATNEIGLTAWSQSDHATARRAFDEAAEAACRIDDARLLASVAHSQALLAGSRGDYVAADTRFAQAAALLDSISDLTRRFFPAATFCLIVGDEAWCPGLRLYYEESMMLFRRVPLPAARAYVLANHAHLLRAAGELDRALTTMEVALREADRSGDVADRAVVLVALGNLRRARAEYDDGRARLQEACEIRRGAGDRRGLAMALGDLGLLEAAAGDGEAGRKLIEQSHLSFSRLDDVVSVAGALLNLANVELSAGERGRAQALLEESLELVSARGLGRMSSWILATLAENELALGNEARGRQLAGRARSALDALGDCRGGAWEARLIPLSRA